MNKKKIIIAATAFVIIGGIIFWYVKYKKPPVSASAAPAANPEKDWLLNTFKATNQPNEDLLLAAIPKMNDAEIHLMYLRAMSQVPGNTVGSQITDSINQQIQATMTKYAIPGL